MQQPTKYEFTRPSSPSTAQLNTVPNVHIQTHFDRNVSPNGIIHVTSISPSESYLEDSCDSYIESEDTEDISMSGEQKGDVVETYPGSFMSALNKAVASSNGGKTDSSDPYHVPINRFQTTLSNDDLSPQKELKNLLKEVESSKPVTPEYSPKECSVVVIDKLTGELPGIEIIEQPETVCYHRVLLL